eukprot:251629-Pleurochrysis_carterae.AAC.2
MAQRAAESLPESQRLHELSHFNWHSPPPPPSRPMTPVAAWSAAEAARPCVRASLVVLWKSPGKVPQEQWLRLPPR